MSYVDYAEEAKANRKQSARCYYESRKDAKRAAHEYEMVRVYERSRNFIARHPELYPDEPNAAASYDRLIRTTIGLADTYLNSAFNGQDRARFYAQLARDYDELADRAYARASEFAREILAR